MKPSLRVRPFRAHVEREHSLPTFDIIGAIEGTGFTIALAALGQTVTLDTVEVGEDERGPYAVVNECDRQLPGGFVLRLELDPDEEGFHGAALAVFLPGRGREALLLQGIDPNSVNVIVRHERGFTIHFDSCGLVNGQGSTRGNDDGDPVAH